MAERILIAEDESAIAELLEYNLEQEGYEVEVVERGDAALASVESARPDLLLLDLMLPGVDGLTVLRRIRKAPASSGLPVIVLTAKGEEVDRIVGLELGADDYVTKPFSPRELLLRVRAVLRRGREEEEAGARLRIGDLDLDVPGHRLQIGGDEVRLTATEFRLLRLLMERRGRVQTREGLLSEVWGYASDVDSRTVDTHIRRLRSKLGEEASRIETVIGVGYRLRG